MREEYQAWLVQQGYAQNTQVAQLHRVRKVEEVYGSLDALIADGQFDAMIDELTYSTADERADRPNPSRIVFNGNIRNNLQSYKNAALRYRTFATGENVEELTDTPSGDRQQAEKIPPATQVGADKLALERDLQAALRRDITSLEPGLEIIDDNMERGVDSGFIDILCRDAQGWLVVIELKAGRTDARVIGQVLGYMGDLAQEEADAEVRGIIVAHEFDKRTRAASRAVPNLSLKSYSISFTFGAVE